MKELTHVKARHERWAERGETLKRPGAGLHPVAFHEISAGGDLRERITRNYRRLEDDYYHPSHVFSSQAHAQWPGDLEGRIILSLVLSAQATGREPKYLQQILDELPSRLNERRYLGGIRPDGQYDEQQFAGHGWVLRGLCEYYLWRQDAAMLPIISGIVQNLFLPATSAFAAYPTQPEHFARSCDVAGRLTGDVQGGWHLSGDCGCAFIALDGVVQAYELLRTPELDALVQSMVAKFMAIDFPNVQTQTHATLSGLRGLLRYYGIKREHGILTHAERLFAQYMRSSITENYENYCWFGRSEFTEPCAFVDAFIIAVELWKHTGAVHYLDDAHHILFNAMGYGQRPNGGWGPDECAGAKSVFLTPTTHSFEAWWCCTMRGAVGLARAIAYSYLRDETRIVVPFYNDNRAHFEFAEHGAVQWEQTSAYPLDGSVTIKVLKSNLTSPKQLSLYLPSWSDRNGVTLSINGQKLPVHLQKGFVQFPARLAEGDTIEFFFPVRLRRCATVNHCNLRGHFTLRHGPVILGLRTTDGAETSIEDLGALQHLKKGVYAVGDTGLNLEPINNLIYETDERARNDCRQILFPSARLRQTHSRLKPMGLNHITVLGDLCERTARNYDRMEDEYYQPPHVFDSTMHAQWPGDLEGRTILALVLLAQATDREPRYLNAILEALPTRLNERGYLGVIRPEGTYDEQQFAGHGWLLRGLCEYYLWRNDPAMLDSIRQIVHNLFIPSTHAFLTYPDRPEQRTSEGEIAGRLTGEVHQNWYTSSDTGCAFIALDGLTHAFELQQSPDLEALIRSMIATYSRIDFAGIRMQTHATLSGLRGLLRFYDAVKEPDLLDQAKRIYGIYMSEAITENYANYGWFRRADWTEPCAVVDAFIVAVELWRKTGAISYLDDAHHILFNAMGYGQRPNGGWGPDECAGARWTFLRPADHSYEAPWCCTMRGAVGLIRAIAYSYLHDADHIVVPFFNNNLAWFSLLDGNVRLQQESAYPIEGLTRIKVLYSTVATPKRLSFYLPSWTNHATAVLTVNGQKVPLNLKNGLVTLTARLAEGDVIQLQFEMALRQSLPVNPRNIPGNFTFRHGPLILGITKPLKFVTIADLAEIQPLGNARYSIGNTGKVLEPINDLFYMLDRHARQDSRQILFPLTQELEGLVGK